MLPAHQGLDAGHPAGGVAAARPGLQGDFGLVVQHQFVAFECFAQLADEREPPRIGRVEARPPGLHRGLTLLGEAERGLGPAKQQLRITPVQRRHRYAHGTAAVESEPGHVDGLEQRLPNGVPRGQRITDVVDPRQQDAEFVIADPGDGGSRAEPVPPAGGPPGPVPHHHWPRRGCR